jgi:hypothetical protein
MRTLAGFFGRACLKTYRSLLGGFHRTASYTGETSRFCVTLVIHTGTLSMRSPPGITIEILTFELWGMAGTPSLAGNVVDQTPKLSLCNGVASLSQLLNSPIKDAFSAFGAHSRYVISPLSAKVKPYFSEPLENFSKPPSVSSIVLIQFWALVKRCFKASLKGDSQGSS